MNMKAMYSSMNAPPPWVLNFVWKPPYVAKTYGGAYRGGYHGKACGKLAATGGYAVVGVWCHCQFSWVFSAGMVL